MCSSYLLLDLWMCQMLVCILTRSSSARRTCIHKIKIAKARGLLWALPPTPLATLSAVPENSAWDWPQQG